MLSMKEEIFLEFIYQSQSIFWTIVGLTVDLKTHRKVVYDNVTNHVITKSLW